MTFHPDQAHPNCKNSHITYRACDQLPLNVDRIDASINTQILKNPHDIIVHLEALDNAIKPGIGTINN